MATVSGTYKTYEQIGRRQDLSDMIFDITPLDTPYVTLCKKGPKMKNTYAEWQKDSIRAANGNNYVLEGNEASFRTATPTVMLRNYAQLMDEAVIVSDTANTINVAGRKKELAYQVAKSGKALRLDMETRATGNYASDDGGATSARRTAGFEAWITTNDSRGTGGVQGGFTSTNLVSAATDASSTNQRAFTETLTKAVLLLIWSNSDGQADTVIVGGFNKQRSSAFAGIAQGTVDYGNRRTANNVAILGAANVYVGDFGAVKIVPDRYSRSRSALFVNRDYVELRMLQPFSVEPLARTGHAEKRLLKVEWAHIMRNEAAHGIVADLTTS